MGYLAGVGIATKLSQRLNRLDRQWLRRTGITVPQIERFDGIIWPPNKLINIERIEANKYRHIGVLDVRNTNILFTLKFYR